MFFLHGKDFDKVTLLPGGPESKLSALPYDPACSETTLSLGTPILSFNLAKTADEEWRSLAKEVLKSWITLDQANIDKKTSGAKAMYEFPVSYKSNFPVKVGKMSGNFQDATITDSFINSLGVLVSRAAATGDLKSFEYLVRFVQQYVHPKLMPDANYRSNISLVVFINTAANKLGLPPIFEVQDMNGNRSAPSVKIIG